jgi:predicted amidohydrolase
VLSDESKKVTGRDDRIVVALGEYDTGWHKPEDSLARAKQLATAARAERARLLVLPEMCATGFTMDVENFSEPMEGKIVRSLSTLARSESIWIIGGVATRDGDQHFNSAIAFGPDGSIAANYHKQKLFGYAGENNVYSGGTEGCVFEMDGVSVALFVCFDLRFPELFREVAPRADVFVVIANWPSARQKHWEILAHARAIENQSYIVAVNRTGKGGGLDYSGGSFILDPWGDRCDRATESGIRIGEVAAGKVEEVRRTFPVRGSERATSSI